MSYGIPEQRCPPIPHRKPWQRKRKSRYARYLKLAKHRVERRKARLNPDCIAEYTRYKGYEK